MRPAQSNPRSAWYNPSGPPVHVGLLLTTALLPFSAAFATQDAEAGAEVVPGIEADPRLGYDISYGQARIPQLDRVVCTGTPYNGEAHGNMEREPGTNTAAGWLVATDVAAEMYMTWTTRFVIPGTASGILQVTSNAGATAGNDSD